MNKERSEVKKNISKWDLDTPALLVDLAALEGNIKKMAEYCRKNHLLLRPHAKTHKCPEIAKLQIASGAIGICTAKVGEAEAMVKGGVRAVLITSPVVTPHKIERLMKLKKTGAQLMVVVDDKKNIEDLSHAAVSHKLTLDVLVSLNPGLNRIGVEPGKPAVDFAREVLTLKGLRFRGIEAYAGQVQHIRGFSERREKSLEALEGPAETKTMMEKEGIEVEFFSGGGTGTYNIDHEVPGFTDLQAGSYIFMDAQYLSIEGRESQDGFFRDFEPSLTVLTTAISQPIKAAITTDAGTKALAQAEPGPIVKDFHGGTYSLFGDEHGSLKFEDPGREIKLGDKVELIVTHCDPAVNLYDHCYGIRNDRVEKIWTISARGQSQ